MTRLAAAALALTSVVAGYGPQGGSRSAADGPERTTVLENSSVVVTRLRFPPGAREEMHAHAFPLLIVQLTKTEATVRDREMLRVGNRVGETFFIAASTRHAVINRSARDLEMLAVALKADRPPAPSAPPTAAPEGITRTTIVDNSDVRVVHVRFAPEAREPVHTHPNDLLTIQITRGRVEIQNGSDRATRECEPGFVQFLPRNVQHTFANADTHPFELLSVSIK